MEVALQIANVETATMTILFIWSYDKGENSTSNSWKFMKYNNLRSWGYFTIST